MENIFPQGVDKLFDMKGAVVVEGSNTDVVNHLLWYPSAITNGVVYSSVIGHAILPKAYLLKFGLPSGDVNLDSDKAHEWQMENNPLYVNAVKPNDVEKAVAFDGVFDDDGECLYSGASDDVMKWLEARYESLLHTRVYVRVRHGSKIMSVAEYVADSYGVAKGNVSRA